MGMSTHVVGIIPPDETWKKMKAVWDSCHAAGVDVPKNVGEFFDWEPPDEKGVLIDLLYAKEAREAVSEFKTDYQDGHEIEIAKLPPHVKIIRVYISW